MHGREKRVLLREYLSRGVSIFRKIKISFLMRARTPMRRRGGDNWVLPPLSVGEMTLRLYAALNYSQNSAHDLRRALNGA